MSRSTFLVGKTLWRRSYNTYSGASRIRSHPLSPYVDATSDGDAFFRPLEAGRPDMPRKKLKTSNENALHGSHDEVLAKDIAALLKQASISSSSATEGPVNGSKEPVVLPEPFKEIDLKVFELSSVGDGLAMSPSSDHIYVVPFSVPGDTVTAKVVKHFPKDAYSLTDFVKVVKPSPLRDDSRVKCQYFSRCSGCLLQMLSYDEQLAHKKRIVEKAYRNFSGLDASIVPAVGDTIGSPLQYGYRTKLTPHFDGPKGNSRRSKGAGRVGFEEMPPIGFTFKGRRHVLDIEDCPIGTDTVRKGMTQERKNVEERLGSYRKGATILLRESTERIPKTESDTQDLGTSHQNGADGHHSTSHDSDNFSEEKVCITDNRATSVEYVDDFVFHNQAGGFFQNNNSILPRFTAYIREHALPLPPKDGLPPIKYLLDAYCGSGLFAITLASQFESSLGIDIDGNQILMGRKNAKMSGVNQASFMEADAAALFKKVEFPADETLLVIDPPRKGCDVNFLHQLLAYGPKRVVYVSCNVHSQARDVGLLVNGDANYRYEIESIVGFDFFPQTGHVESVAILNREENRST